MTSSGIANRERWQTIRENNPLCATMAALSEHARAVATGIINEPTIVCGPPGIGKSHVFRVACQEAGRGCVHIKSGTSLGLLADLEMCARRRYLAIVDDADAIWTDRARLQILMEATQPQVNGARRRYRHKTATTERVYDFTNLVIVIISNSDVTNLSTFGRSIRPALAALVDRCATIVVKASLDDIYEHTCCIAILDEVHRDQPVEFQNDALRWFAEHRDFLPSATPRMLAKIVETRRVFADWRRQLRLRLQLDDDVQPMYLPDTEIPRVIPILRAAA